VTPKARLRATATATVLLFGTTAACTALIGLQDVPSPADGGTESGLPPEAGDAATSDAATGDAATSDAVTGDVLDAPQGPCTSREFGTPVPVAELNTTDGTSWDYSAHLSPDELTVYFTSTRPNGPGQASLYVATRPSKKDPFGTPAPIPNVNSQFSDEFPSVSADGLMLVFSSDRANPGYEHIYVSTRSSTSSAFGAPVLVSSLTSSAVDREGYLLPAGTELYFASNRAGGAGSDDIYRSFIHGGSFQQPSDVSELSTQYEEEHPTVSGDDLTIFFASTRPDLGAQGSWDILVATRASTSASFNSITNVEKLNSPYGDLPDWISPDGCTLYMSSTRGPGGSWQLYVATRQ
jgi:Tol biopolymer transport system component